MANETLNLKNINVLTEAQYKSISDSNIKKDELYMIPIELPQDYIIESYNNGSSWYEVYKSGKIRQGGLITKSSSVVTYTISLLKKMKNTTYYCNVFDAYDSTSYSPISKLKSCTTTSFTVDLQNLTHSYGGARWIVEGLG